MLDRRPPTADRGRWHHGVAGLRRRGASAAIEEGEYPSKLFEQFCAAIERRGADAKILNIEPTTAGNLIFWANKVHRVSTLDYVRRAGGKEPGSLDLPDTQFDGILCWTVFSHLDRTEALEFSARLEQVLKPGGMLFAIFDGDGQQRPLPMRYRILDAQRLRFERLSDRAAPRAVPTNEVQELLRNFRPVHMAVMRHGSREALAVYPEL